MCLHMFTIFIQGAWTEHHGPLLKVGGTSDSQIGAAGAVALASGLWSSTEALKIHCVTTGLPSDWHRLLVMAIKKFSLIRWGSL